MLIGRPIVADVTSGQGATGRVGAVLLDLVLAAGRRRCYPRGSLVFAEGDRAHEVLLVRTGTVKVTVAAPDGRQVVVDLLDRGELIGELAALDGAGRTANAFAVTAVEVVAVPTSVFVRLLTDHEGAALALAALLAVRLRTAAQRCVELSTADAVARVCSRLDELGSRYGRTNLAGELRIDSPITQSELAQWAGLSREAVVKSLRSLRRVGWIDVRGGTFVIRDRDALRSRAAL